MKRFAIAVALLACGACVHQARIYNVDSGQILIASFKYSGTGNGDLWLGTTSFKAAACKGEYVTVPSGDFGWGNIYSGGQMAMAQISSMSADQRGSAVATCVDGTVYQCEYVTSAYTAKGSGACRDNRGTNYRLMF